MNQDFVQFPQAIDMEKYVLSAMLLQDGVAIPKAAAILSADDFFYPEHQIVFSTMMKLYSQGTVPDILLIAEELRKSDMRQLRPTKVGRLRVPIRKYRQPQFT